MQQGNLDWQQLAIAYGPIVPVILFLLKVHWDTVYRVIPASIRQLRFELRRSGKANERIARALCRLESIKAANAQEKVKAAASRRRRAGGSSRKKRARSFTGRGRA